MLVRAFPYEGTDLAVDLRQLAYFVAVAEEGQVTRAAVRSSVAQPAVSAQIRRLEHELGETLFRRDPQGTSLTVAGEALLPHALAALAAAERGRDAIASLRGLLHGRLRVGISRPVDARLAETLGEFHRTHPAIEIVLTEQHNDPLIKALAHGAIDAALVGMHRPTVPPPIRTRIVVVEPLVLAVPPDHPLGRRGTVTLIELRDQPIITLTRGSGLRTVLEGAYRDVGLVPRIVAETGELSSVVELAVAGLGAAILPRSAICGTCLRAVDIDRPRLCRRTALAWNPAASTPAGRAFLSLAEKTLPADE